MDRLVDMLAGRQPLPPTRFLSHEGYIEDSEWERLVEALCTNKEAVGIRLRDCGLVASHARQLADALASNTSLECLELPDNGIDENGARALVAILQASNCTLKSIDLSGNPCEDAAHLLHDMDALLRRNRVIKKLPKTPSAWTPRDVGEPASTPSCLPGGAAFFTPAQAFPTPQQSQVKPEEICSLTPPGLMMSGTAFNVEQRLQHLEEAEATIRSELQHARSFSSQSEMWQRKIDMAGQQIAAILSLVESRNLALETRLHTMERWRASAEQAWADQSKVFEGMAAQLLGLQVRVQMLERHVGRPDVCRAAASGSANPLLTGALWQEVQTLGERLQKLECAVGNASSGGQQCGLDVPVGGGVAVKAVQQLLDMDDTQGASPEEMPASGQTRGTDPGCHNPEPTEASFELPRQRTLSSDLVSHDVTPGLKATAPEPEAGCGGDGGSSSCSGLEAPFELLSLREDGDKASVSAVPEQEDREAVRPSTTAALDERDSHARRRGSSPSRPYDADLPRMAPFAMGASTAQPRQAQPQATGVAFHRQPVFAEGSTTPQHSASKHCGGMATGGWGAPHLATPEGSTGGVFSAGAAVTPYGVEGCNSPGTPRGSTFSVDAMTVSLSVALANSAARPRAPGAATSTHGSPPTAAQSTHEPAEVDGCWGSDQPRGRHQQQQQQQEEPSDSTCSSSSCRHQMAVACSASTQQAASERSAGPPSQLLQASATSDEGQVLASAAEQATATADPFTAPCLSVRQWVEAAQQCGTPTGTGTGADSAAAVAPRASTEMSTPNSKPSASHGVTSTTAGAAGADGHARAHAQEQAVVARSGHTARLAHTGANAPHAATSLVAMAASMEGTERRSSLSVSQRKIGGVGAGSYHAQGARQGAVGPPTVSSGSSRRVPARDSEQTHDQGPGHPTRTVPTRGDVSGSAASKAVTVRTSIPSFKQAGSAIPRASSANNAGHSAQATDQTARATSTATTTQDCPLRQSTHRHRKADDGAEPVSIGFAVDGPASEHRSLTSAKLQQAGPMGHKQHSSVGVTARSRASVSESQDAVHWHEDGKDQAGMEGDVASNGMGTAGKDPNMPHPQHHVSRSQKANSTGIAGVPKLQLQSLGGSNAAVAKAGAAVVPATKASARYVAGDSVKASKRWM